MGTSAAMYVTDISHPLNSARTRAPMQMGMSAGMLVGPAFGGFLLENVGLQYTAMGVGVATWTTAAMASFLLPETLPKRCIADDKPLKGVGETLRSWKPILQDPQFRTILCWGWFYNAAFWGGMSLLPLVYVDLALSPMV